MTVESIWSTVVNMVLVLLSCVIFVGIFIRFAKNRFAAVKTVEATVVDKQKFTKRVVSKTQAPHDDKKYVVVFQTRRKKRSFYVSEFSYGGYRLNQKGKLTYKGDRIIDFK